MLRHITALLGRMRDGVCCYQTLGHGNIARYLPQACLGKIWTCGYGAQSQQLDRFRCGDWHSRADNLGSCSIITYTIGLACMARGSRTARFGSCGISNHVYGTRAIGFDLPRSRDRAIYAGCWFAIEYALLGNN